jgi:hypothetical protein
MADYVAQRDAERRGAERIRTSYTDEQVAKSLNALVAFGGSPSQASRALAEAFDLDVPATTLRAWRDSVYAERYVQLQAEHGAEIEQAIIRDTRDLARAAAHVERLAIEQAVEGLHAGRIRPTEASQIAVNMAKLKQSNIDKLLALTGRPQAITEHRSAQELIRALAAKGVLELEPSVEP